LIIDGDGETRIDANSGDILVLNNTTTSATQGYIQYELEGTELWEAGVDSSGTYWLFNDQFSLNTFESTPDGARVITVDTSLDGLEVERSNGTEFLDAYVESGRGTLQIGSGFPDSEVIFTNDGSDMWSVGSNDTADGTDSFFIWNEGAGEYALTVNSSSDFILDSGSLRINTNNDAAFIVEDASGNDVFEVDTDGAGATGITIGDGTQIEKILHFAVDFNPGTSGAGPNVVCATGTVTGAATTDRIIANPDPNDLSNSFAWHGARVSASNTVESCFFTSASTLDPGAAITVFGIIITP
jgi:hypothetical protein